jgi:hypothetical protein
MRLIHNRVAFNLGYYIPTKFKYSVDKLTVTGLFVGSGDITIRELLPPGVLYDRCKQAKHCP